MKKLVSILLLLLSLIIATNASPIDSLKKELAKAGNDNKRKAMLYYKLGQNYSVVDVTKSIFYLRQSINHALESKDPYTIAIAYVSTAIIYEHAGRLEEMKPLLDSAKTYSQQSGNVRCLFTLQQAYSSYYRRKANYSEALSYAFDALKIAKGNNNDTLIYRALNNIGGIYVTNRDLTLAEEIYDEGIVYAKKLNDSSALSRLYNNMGIVNRELELYDKALEYYYKSLGISIALNDSSDISFLYNDIGAAYSKKGDVAKGEKYLKQSIDIRERMGEMHELAYTYNYLGENYERKNDLINAGLFIKKALSTAQKIGNNKQAYEAYESLSNFYARNKMYDSAYRYAILFKSFRDSIRQMDNEKNIAELTTQYETEKKEQKIREQQLQLKQRNYLLTGGGIALVLGTLLTLSAYKRNKLQQEAKLQKELMQHQELTTKAVLEAEEIERKRIAADLHDSVGQMMSAAKLNLNLAASDMDYASEVQKCAMEKAIALIDDSCKEVRTVSHNLMPNALLKSGLGKAINAFINKIDSHIIKITLYTEGLEERIDEKVEMVLYRVIQECVNNVIKHSDANRLDISLVKDADGISITLEDNGKGFDANNIDNYSGIGLKNIRSRIEYLKGTVEWDSAPGKGTVVTILV